MKGEHFASRSADGGHDVSGFSCGKPALDRWLKTRAVLQSRKGFTSVMVVHGADEVVGYHGRRATAGLRRALPRSIRSASRPSRSSSTVEFGSVRGQASRKSERYGNAQACAGIARQAAAQPDWRDVHSSSMSVDIEGAIRRDSGARYSFHRRHADVVEGLLANIAASSPTVQIARSKRMRPSC